MKLKMIIPILCFAAAGCTGGKLTSGLDKANMNDSIAPGEDFYEYCAGGWMKANPLKPEYSSFGQFNVLADNIISINQIQILTLQYEKASSNNRVRFAGCITGSGTE